MAAALPQQWREKSCKRVKRLCGNQDRLSLNLFTASSMTLISASQEKRRSWFGQRGQVVDILFADSAYR